MNESFDESPQWKEGAYVLSEEEYPWVREARGCTSKVFKRRVQVRYFREKSMKSRYIRP